MKNINMDDTSNTALQIILDAFAPITISETIHNLIKIALTTDNIYFRTPTERENLLYFEELFNRCFNGVGRIDQLSDAGDI